MYSRKSIFSINDDCPSKSKAPIGLINIISPYVELLVCKFNGDVLNLSNPVYSNASKSFKSVN